MASKKPRTKPTKAGDESRSPSTSPRVPRQAPRTANPLQSGPHKERKAGPPPPRLSRHKARAGWFRARVAWPLREPEVVRLQRERRRARTSLPAVKVAAAWELAGPGNIGGRCTSLVCCPDHPARLWIGAAGGGVWASSDGGQT